MLGEHEIGQGQGAWVRGGSGGGRVGWRCRKGERKEAMRKPQRLEIYDVSRGKALHNGPSFESGNVTGRWSPSQTCPQPDASHHNTTRPPKAPLLTGCSESLLPVRLKICKLQRAP